MPSSERKKLLIWIREQLFLTGVYQMTVDWDTAEGRWINDQAEDHMAWLAAVSSVRYLSTPTSIKKSISYSELVFRLPTREFRQALRVVKSVFVDVCSIIAGDEIFSSVSMNQQRPVHIQVAVTLERLGAYGNGSSVGKLARAYGIASGSVTLYSKRVVFALLRHYGEYVYWPSAQEREITSTFYGQRYGMEGAVGFVDGTHFIFGQKPGVDGKTFFNRKTLFIERYDSLQ
ncbi:hypothetical protein PHMEG_00026054 [Phytophthora megakarya]|uniref:DDE Tnp4 domain-containing protein n=1 Tax=Phytophthora megakarya TaxID=4795 RepID=A0A225VC91_9STRA|nr:hypothetical protein PHMEG_00026054 [Phytophthora megakarya]